MVAASDNNTALVGLEGGPSHLHHFRIPMDRDMIWTLELLLDFLADLDPGLLGVIIS